MRLFFETCTASSAPAFRHSNHGDLAARLFNNIKSKSGNGIAGDNDQFGLIAHENGGIVCRIFPDGNLGFWSVWNPCRIAEVDNPLGRQSGLYCLDNSQSANTGVKDTNRAFSESMEHDLQLTVDNGSHDHH